MRKADVVRLRHILDAAQEAIDFARGRARTDLDTDRQLVLALVKEMEIIGEASYQLTVEARERLPTIPWDDIIGMRHRLVHAYFDINLDILWRTVCDDLPALVSALKPHIPPE